MKQLIFALTLLITACSQNIAPPALHDLGLPGMAVNNHTVTSINVTAPEWLRDYRIHYRLLYNNPTQVRFYTLDRWLAPLPELFQQRLLTGGIAYQNPLDIELLEFEQQFTIPEQARVVMRFNVLAYSANRRQLIAGKQFILQQTAPSADAQGAVTAFADLTRQAVDNINGWLATANIDN